MPKYKVPSCLILLSMVAQSCLSQQISDDPLAWFSVEVEQEEEEEIIEEDDDEEMPTEDEDEEPDEEKDKALYMVLDGLFMLAALCVFLFVLGFCALCCCRFLGKLHCDGKMLFVVAPDPNEKIKVPQVIKVNKPAAAQSTEERQ